MAQLTAADVDALRCAFVHSIYTYTKCKKYSISCSLDEAIEDYLNYELANVDCALSEDDTCRLKNAVEPSLIVDCTINTPCYAQAAITIKDISGGPLLYTPTIIDETFDTSAPVFSARGNLNLIPNSIFQEASLEVGIIDQNFDIIDTATFTTGKAKVGASVVTSDIYKPYVSTHMAFTTGNSATGYIKTIRIYYTNTIGQFVNNQYWDIDVSPLTSPYLACGTCTVVNPAHLYLNNNSGLWSTAMRNVVHNAVRVLTGAVNIEFTCYKEDVAPFRSYYYTSLKHLPTSTYAALRPKDFLLFYTNGVQNFKGSSSIVGPAYWPSGSPNLYGKADFVLSCATKTIEVPNVMMGFDGPGILDQVNSEFNEIKLLSNKTFLPATIADQTTLDCTTSSYVATVSSNEVVTGVQWLNSSYTLLATGYSFSPPAAGDYIARVTLASGCVIDTMFTASSAGVQFTYLITEGDDYIMTEDSLNIKL